MNVGKVVQVIGNVVDVAFEEGKLPPCLTRLPSPTPVSMRRKTTW